MPAYFDSCKVVEKEELSITGKFIYTEVPAAGEV